MDVFDLNKKYEENNFNGTISNSNINIIKGNNSLLLSAPHSVKHYRNNRILDADGLTGGIVEYLSLFNNTYGITRLFNMMDDPNYYGYGYSLEYKKRILKLIRNYCINYMFDIHGCRDNDAFNIDIGINNYRNINDELALDILVEYLSNLGKVTIDNKYKANRDSNVSKYVHDFSGISCFQIEISNYLRFNKTNELIDSFNKTIDEYKVYKLIK